MKTSKLFRYKVRRALTENVGLKLLSLFIAVVLWTIASGERDAEWAYLVPLQIKNKPENLVIINNVPEFLDVRVQGGRSFMVGLRPQDMTVQLDASDLKTGSNLFPVTPDHIRIPRGVKVNRINPSYITLDAERRLTRRVKLIGELQGTPAAGFFVDTVAVMPASVEITGGESEVRNIDILRTSPLDITGVRADVTRETLVDLPAKGAALVVDKPVTVRVAIREVTGKREMKGVPVKAINTEHAASVNTSVYLLLEGPKSVVEGFTKETMNIYVDAAGLEPGKYYREVVIGLPPEVKVLYSQPKKVTVRLKKK